MANQDDVKYLREKLSHYGFTAWQQWLGEALLVILETLIEIKDGKSG
jgi:hypothetical protein